MWKTKYNFIIFCYSILLFWIVILIYYEKIINAWYIGGALLITFLFFFFLNHLEKTWGALTDKQFERRLFVTGLCIRLTGMTGLYFFYQYQTGQPFEYYAVDSIFYHDKGQFIADNFSKMNFNVAELTRDLEFSDKGFNVYLGFIYYLFGPEIIIPRLFNVVYSTVTVLLIYRIGRELLGERTGRIAGIMALLLPNFILYLGTHLKETLMVMLVVFALYQSVRIVKLGKRQVINLALLVLTIFILFMFRTVLAAITFASVLAYILLYKASSSKIFNVAAAIFILLLFASLVLRSDIGNEVAAFYEKRTSALSDNMQFRAAREGGNKYALLASAPLFLSVIVMAPFPSFVYVFEQDNLWMFLGANFIRNLYAFFAIAGIIYSIRFRFRETSLLLSFALGYFGILANSGFAISERFHLPVIPVLILLAAAGIDKTRQLKQTYYLVYLALVAILIIGWNYIKLSGRA